MSKARLRELAIIAHQAMFSNLDPNEVNERVHDFELYYKAEIKAARKAGVFVGTPTGISILNVPAHQFIAELDAEIARVFPAREREHTFFEDVAREVGRELLHEAEEEAMIQARKCCVIL